MPFFMVDDQLHVNRKATALAERALDNDLLGFAALGLWSMAGSFCQAALSDGRISERELVKISLNKEAVDLLAQTLVKAGLWHGHGHDCERCPTVPERSYLFHDWFSLGYSTGADVKLARDKRKELKDPKLIASVWARDCTDFPKASCGNCRYCGREVKRATQKGDLRPEMDHIDPTKAIGPVNVVLACAECNRKKGRRTPDQAGMTLRQAPARAAASAPVETRSPHVAAGQDTPGASIARETVEPAQDTAAWFNARIGAPPAASRIETPIESDPPAGSNPISDESAVHGHAHVGARAGRAGQGLSTGLSDGSPAGQPTPSDPSAPKPKPRRRKRGSKGNPVGSGSAVGSGREVVPDGGPAPEVPTGGTFGSPWYGWSGKASEVTETTCPEHGLEQPCWKCQNEAGAR